MDIGLEPACVNVCLEHAIISGDMDNPDTEISMLLSKQQVTTRKPEKGTRPNVFYIDGDEASLNPSATERSDSYIWSSQSTGVGHYAKYAEKLTEGTDLISMVQDLEGNKSSSKITTYGGDSPKRQVEVIMQSAKARRVYDAPDKGILWGWEVSAYVLTKAVSAGVFLVYFLGAMLGKPVTTELAYSTGIISLIFLLFTGILLVMDLDRPDRFLYVLLRPHWESWLVKGGYSITVFGGLVTLWMAGMYFNIGLLTTIGFYGGFLFAILVAIYTAFLFAQAKGRDFWQSPSVVYHMLVHSVMAGAAGILLYTTLMGVGEDLTIFLTHVLIGSIILNLLIMMIEITITHPTQDAKTVVKMIVNGRYASLFWIWVILITNIVPLILLWVGGLYLIGFAAVLTIVGIYITEKIWVEAPQRISLT